ncbi:MAG: LysR family transcriptional regulator [Chloroflexi bacterium]|nr:LysR family transcriptional regulator [Chloroflexota bacterium]
MPTPRLDRAPNEAFEHLFETRVTVHQLRVFKTVADQRGFTRAAETLHLSQPAISHQMKGLAIALGTTLFEEVGRQSRLTAAGELLYEHTGRILAEFGLAGRAFDELHGLQRGHLRVFGDTTVGIYVLPDVLGAFKEQQAGIDVRLDVGNRQQLFDRFATNSADFGVIGHLWDRPLIPLVSQPFLPNELVAIASPRHPLAAMKKISLARLADEPFIVREIGSGTRETADAALARSGRSPHILMELASNGAIKRAVARGLGVSILSRHAVALELRLGLVVELPVTGFPLRRQWHLVYPRDHHLSLAAEAFLAFIDRGQWREGISETLTSD